MVSEYMRLLPLTLSLMATGCYKIHSTPRVAWGAMFVGLLVVLISSGGDRKAASGIAVVAGALLFLWG